MISASFFGRYAAVRSVAIITARTSGFITSGRQIVCPPKRIQSFHSRCHSTTASTTSNANGDAKPCSVAIVGTGPSGCYTAKYLLNAFDKKSTTNSSGIHIDMLERLPTPYGLVRYGVAPDHPEVKNVENDFAQLFVDSNRIQFWGNVAVGSDAVVSLEELRELYDVVVLAYGCASDRKLGLPGETSLLGIVSAREFVAWYNGHPYFDHIGYEVANALGNDNNDNPKHVVIIGQGNVALDCARVLAKGAQGLKDTDIASRSLPIIGEDGVANVTVVGRRGHIQGAFTIKELRELTKLQAEGHGAKFVVLEEELDLGETPASKQELEQKGSRPKVRINKLLRDAAAASSNHDDTTTMDTKQVQLRFLLSPKEFQPSDADPSAVGAVVCERTQLEGEPGKQRAVGTGQLETFPANLVLVSIGYKGTPLPGLEQWFDAQRGVVQNRGGKVDEATAALGGLYVSGWLKRGPSGIIGTNIMDAKDTVVNIMKDLDASNSDDSKSDAREKLLELLQQRGVHVVSWSDFQKIDAKETSASYKRTDQQPREKIVELDEMLEAAGVASR
ncbi:Probable ferredoxin/ferredoxin--NADP reductase [Seminavis robusta]|uniref:NADPH:adrenodoxin oxidoreductase, mitochondrial n=1 Tax=Seminavis robusta TaxID=568900 RepID=A0A9N8HTN7_9STRA|nr:Probable ferredoxin/ferredoxin--NADP reductase [Seminavis robusta]|eukprot:Sro1295_g260320.1 Probable ferredoxin/ferredoxin--NADP reductase (560) ;mRNA; r:26076-27755